MARTDNFTGKVMNCIVCTNPIPSDRRWDAVTCSKECSKARQDFYRSRADLAAECRYCRRPANARGTQPLRCRVWRRWEKAGQGDEASAAALLRENVRLKQKLTQLQSPETATYEEENPEHQS